MMRWKEKQYRGKRGVEYHDGGYKGSKTDTRQKSPVDGDREIAQVKKITGWREKLKGRYRQGGRLVVLSSIQVGWMMMCKHGGEKDRQDVRGLKGVWKYQEQERYKEDGSKHINTTSSHTVRWSRRGELFGRVTRGKGCGEAHTTTHDNIRAEKV